MSLPFLQLRPPGPDWRVKLGLPTWQARNGRDQGDGMELGMSPVLQAGTCIYANVDPPHGWSKPDQGLQHVFCG